MGVPAGEADRAEEGVGDRPLSRGEVNRSVRAKCTEAAAPDGCGGVGADEVPLCRDQELSARGKSRASEEAPDREGREPSAFLEPTEDGPFAEVDLVGKSWEPQPTIRDPNVKESIWVCGG